MKITQVRNATVIIEYGGKRFLVDPMLGDKGSFGPFPMTGNKERNPLYDLPMSIDEILKDIDAVIITHTHKDHIDQKAIEVLDKRMKIYVQDEKDKKFFSDRGFTNVEILTADTRLGDVEMTKTPSKHGAFPMIMFAGHTCGVIFHSKDEKSLYLIGDSIWYDGVEKTLRKYKPEVILINCGGNKFNGFRPVIMHEPDVLKVYQEMPNSQLVATHLEGVNHNTVTRKSLRAFSEEHGFSEKILIPEDGESVIIQA